MSRTWYASIECDGRARPSTLLLNRLAEALMLNLEERRLLFSLAFPELELGAPCPLPEMRSTSLSERSTEVRGAFGSIRSLTQRLWVATSEDEILRVAREHLIKRFTADTVRTHTRIREGWWDSNDTGDSKVSRRYDQLVFDGWSGADIDDLCCYRFLTRPGGVMTRFERNALLPDLAAKESRVLGAMALNDVSYAMASVRSNRGFIANLTVVHYTRHEYSNEERAQLSTVADVMSLALRG